MRTMPLLEPLEARIAPATIIVNSLADPTEAGKTTLRDALALADSPSHPGPDTIVFQLPGAVIPGANTIKLNGTELTSGGNVTIIGPGAGKLIIDGDGKSRIFDFNDNASSADSPVSISGLSIINGHAKGGVGIGTYAQNNYGGGIYSAESLTLKNVVISGNTADQDSGGVSVAGNKTDTKLSISNCVITSNTASADGGALEGFYLKSATISNTTISGNTAGNHGGGIAVGNDTGGKDIAITGCVISGNTANFGGGVWVENLGTGKTTISATKITGNVSTDKTGSHGGGGIYVERGTTIITGCTVSNNTAIYDGGGIFAHNFDSLTISKSTISGNRTIGTNASGHGGGGVFILGDSTGTLDPVSILNSLISDNQSALDGGGVLAKNGIALSVSGSTFSGNHATGIGGGIATRGNNANKVDLTVTGGEFSGNTADAGGGISAEGGNSGAGDGTFSLTGSKVTGNTASGGGGVEVATNAGVTFKNAVVTGNVGTNYGGGLTVTTAQNFLISGGSISGNFSNRGAGVWAYNSAGSILGTTISGNAAKTDGGGVQAFNSSVTVQVAKVTGNTAPSSPNLSSVAGNFIPSGPAAAAPAAGHTGIVITTIQDVVDANDGVTSLREALAQADLTPDTVDTISFAPQESPVDGAWIIKLNGTELSSLGNVKIIGPGPGKLILDGDGKSRVLNIYSPGDDTPVTISGLSIVNGQLSGSSGAAIKCAESLTLKNVVISGNSDSSVNTQGGGVEAFGTKATISNSFFTGNQSGGSGGGLFLATGSITFKNSIVTGNTAAADNHSGGMFAEVLKRNGYVGSMAISDSLISGNSAGYAGGLYLNNDSEAASKITVSNTKITGNAATATSGTQQGGGGVYIDFATNTTITGCTISNNESATGGGGIKVSTFSSLAISKSTISGNRATSGGGLLAEGDATNPLDLVTITKSVIADNGAASGNGGGVNAFGGVLLKLSNSTVTGNHASDKGGGVRSNDSLTVSGGTFADNIGKYGGGIHATGALTISTAKITGNVATKGGGGVYASGITGTLSLQKNSFTENSASTGGGLFILNTPNFTISGGSFTANSALQGGGINLDGSAGSILKALITGNVANKGGGIFNSGTTANAITLQIAKVIANTAVTAPNVGDDPGDLSTFNFVPPLP